MQIFNWVLLGGAIFATLYVIGRPVAHSLRGKTKNEKPDKDDDDGGAVNHRLLRFLSRFLFVILTVALVWSIFLLVWGVANPDFREQATSISTLIVSVATLFSIIMAFYSFIHRR